jgi:DNA polymerase elongation subunit (family B)
MSKKEFELELTSDNRIPREKRVEYFKLAIKRGMTFLGWDIETSHMLVRTFYIGQKVRLGTDQIVAPTKVISIQYQNAKHKKAKYLEWDKVSDEIGSNGFDDSSMIEEFITNIFPEADIQLTQNGDAFDFKILNERAKVLGLPPVPNIPSLDILKLSRRSVRAVSHRLDYRSKQQGLGGKIKMYDQDWVDIEENDVPVSKKMGPYGCKDVEDTLELFWAELPYYKDLPLKIEQIVLDYLVGPGNRNPLRNKKVYCPSCRNKRRLASDVRQINRKKYECNRCTEVFKV